LGLAEAGAGGVAGRGSRGEADMVTSRRTKGAVAGVVWRLFRVRASARTVRRGEEKWPRVVRGVVRWWQTRQRGWRAWLESEGSP